MSGTDEMSGASQPPVVDALIAEELARLGEVEAEDEEKRFARSGGELLADEDVATVATLVELASTTAASPGLDELSHRRVWKRVAQRLGIGNDQADPSTVRRGVVRTLVAAAAMAACVALMVRISPDVPSGADEAERAALQSLGEQLRDSVEALDDRPDSERARALADHYAQRLRGSRPAAKERGR